MCLAFSESLDKNPKGGHPHSCICNPNLLLTDTLYSYMCECVFLATSPKKSVVRVVGNFTQMGTKGHRMVLLAMAFSAATTITPPLLRRVFGSPQIHTWFILVKGA